MGINNSGATSMGGSSSAFQTNATHPYFSYPYSVMKLTPYVRHGLLGPGIISLLSVVTTVGLLLYLAQRFVNWRKYSKTYLGYNQYLVLFINLLFADLLQAMSFTVSLHWIQLDAILAPTPACTAQGWLLNFGDVSSGLFVLLIAISTFHSVIRGRRIPHKAFLAIIAFAWTLAFVVTFIGPAMYGNTYYVRAGVWCWASALYETERLALHYIWVFAVQALTLIIYIAVFIHVRTTMRTTSGLIMANSQRDEARSKIDRATRCMILYPIAYICLTLPLSAGRMWSLAHAGAFLPDAYVLVAGSLIASSGFVDGILYALTRSQLMHTSPMTNASSDPASSDGNNAPRPGGLLRGLSARFDSKQEKSAALPEAPEQVAVVVRRVPDPYCLDDFEEMQRKEQRASVREVPEESEGESTRAKEDV